jgi:ethanolamine transporter EutH
MDKPVNNTRISHLKILGVFHLIVGALAGLCACYPILFLVMGIRMYSELPQGMLTTSSMIPYLLWLILLTAVLCTTIVLGWMLAIAVMLNGFYLFSRKWRAYCLVVSIIETLFIPYGTLLGLISFNLLRKPGVPELFS